MAERRVRNVSGWVLLAVGLGLIGVGTFQLWRFWDVPPGSPGTEGLLFPLVFGLVFLGMGIYSLVKNKPITDDGEVSYPYLFKNRERAEARHRSAQQAAEVGQGRIFPKRPGNPTAVLVIGLVGLVVAVASIPVVIADPLAVGGRGMPMYLVPLALFPIGAWFVTLGAVWRRRDRTPR